MGDDPAARIRLEGADPTNWASLGLRKLVRGYVASIAACGDAFVLLLPDTEYPVPKPQHPAFARVTKGRAVAAFRRAGAGVALAAVAQPAFEPRVARVLAERARLEALGIAGAEERGSESLVAFAMNAYDEFGLHCAFEEA